MDFVTGNNSNISQLEKQTETDSTYVDEEISELEKRLPELEAAIQKLLAGQLTATGLDGQIVQVDVSELIMGNTVNIAAKINQSEQVHLDEQKISLKLQQLLSDNPIYQQLVIAFKQKQEIKQEMAIAGLIPASISGEDNDDEESLVTPAKPGFKGKLILSNYRWGLLIKKLGWLGSFLNSKWLSLLALAILFFWGGGWLLFSIFGFGGQIADNNVYNPSSSNSFTTAAPLQITTISNLNLATPTPKKADNTRNSRSLQNGTYNNLDFETNYIVAEPIEPTNGNGRTDTPTETSITPLPTATNTDNKGANGATTDSINSDDSDAERVGLPSVAAGGFNGPHGAFLAPSQLAVPALNLNVPIARAIIQEQDSFVTTTTNSNTITATTIISGENSTDITATIIEATVQPKLTLTWPRPGEISQLGAYPGELGNCILLGTQESLAPLRYLQVSDEISLYDRKNNRYIYRVVPFSLAGLPERVVSPITDTWLFDQPNNLAELTIIVSIPQPQPPISYNALENGSSSGNNQTQNLTDYTSSQKLAYRAILVSYAPSSSAALAGTPVAVPIQAWQVPPIPTFTVTPTPTNTPDINNAATTTSPIAISPSPSIKPVDTPTINIPSKLPDTGKGGASNSTNQK